MNSIGLPVANLCYLYNALIDIMITLEKLSIFLKRLETFNKKYLTQPSLLCVLIFAVCFIIDLPYFFIYEPTAQLVYFSPNETYLSYNYHMTEFAESMVGMVIVNVQYACRDILPLLVLPILNIVLTLELRKNMKKKGAKWAF
jgi:hypothetical protein